MRFLGSASLVVLALAWSTLVGWWASRRICAGLHRAERLAWAFVAGMLVQIAAYLACLGLHAPAAPLLLGGLQLLIAGAAQLFGQWRVPARPPAAESRVTRAILVAAAMTVSVYLLQAISEPMWSNDFIAIWGYKGKTIYVTQSIPARIFRDPATAWSHPEYPLTLPLELASLAALAQRWDDQALAFFYPTCEAAVVLLLFGFLARRGRGLAGAVASLLAASGFLRFHPLTTGMAEIPMALGFALSGAALLDILEEAIPAKCGRAMLAFIFCASLKQEGVLFAAMLCATLATLVLARRARPRPLLWTAVPTALSPLLLRLLRGPLRDRDFDWSYLTPGRWAALLSRLEGVGRLILFREARPLAIPLLALAAYFFLTQRARADLLVPVIGLQVIAYAGLCAFSAYDPAWLEATAFARITAALWPAVCLVLASRLPAGRPGVSNETA